MKKIFLLSGPNKKTGFSKMISGELKNELNDKKSLVAIAANCFEHSKNDKYFFGTSESLGVIKSFSSIGIEIQNYYLLDSRTDNKKAREILTNADIIYLLGGDPFEQLKYIKSSKFLPIIKKFAGIIIGVSAGTMNLAKNSYYSRDEIMPNSFFYKGLGIVNVSIDPHFDISCSEQVEDAKKFGKQHEIIGLPNDSGIIISDEGKKYIGTYYVFN